jgi:hypothetical protein
MQDVESRNAGVQEFRIALGKRRIRHGEAERGARHQDKAAAASDSTKRWNVVLVRRDEDNPIPGDLPRRKSRANLFAIPQVRVTRK